MGAEGLRSAGAQGTSVMRSNATGIYAICVKQEQPLTVHHAVLRHAVLRCPVQVAGRTNDSAGDGTTTASVLAREMIHFGLQCVTAGANPIAVKKGIDKTQEYLVGKLKENAKPVQGRQDIRVSLWLK